MNQKLQRSQKHTQKSLIAEQDGFLVVTQLVKTGGADQGGVVVGDIFTKFGLYTKADRPSLQHIANYVRGHANTPIEVVVLRKVAVDQNQGPHRKKGAVFQKIRLELRPMSSQDADGGGVL